MKKIVSLLLAWIMVFSLAVPVFAVQEESPEGDPMAAPYGQNDLPAGDGSGDGLVVETEPPADEMTGPTAEPTPCPESLSQWTEPFPDFLP